MRGCGILCAVVDRCPHGVYSITSAATMAMAQQKGKCMGLLLLKDRDGRYRHTRYAIVNVNGKRTGQPPN